MEAWNECLGQGGQEPVMKAPMRPVAWPLVIIPLLTAMAVITRRMARVKLWRNSTRSFVLTEKT